MSWTLASASGTRPPLARRHRVSAVVPVDGAALRGFQRPSFLPCVESLLKAGANASLKDAVSDGAEGLGGRPSAQDGRTALDNAKKYGRTEVIKLLEKYTPTYFAAQVGRASPRRAAPRRGLSMCTPHFS